MILITYIKSVIGVTSGDFLHKSGPILRARWLPDAYTPLLRTFNSFKDAP